MKFKAIAASLSAATTSLFATAVLATEETGDFDVSEATAKLGEIDGALLAIGGVIISLAAVAVGFKWIKGMIFG